MNIISRYGAPWITHDDVIKWKLSLCVGNSPVAGEFPSQRPVTRSFDVFFDLRLNKRLSKQSWSWWFETPSRSSWGHCNGMIMSWHGGIFRMTGPTDDVWILITHKWPSMPSLLFPVILALTSCSTNTRAAGDLKRHHANVASLLCDVYLKS